MCEQMPENICRMCGVCCHKVFNKNGKKYYLEGQYCEMLDIKTKKCTVYKDRFEKHKTCVDIATAIKENILPSDCPYIKYFGVTNYKGRDAWY